MPLEFVETKLKISLIESVDRIIQQKKKRERRKFNNYFSHHD